MHRLPVSRGLLGAAVVAVLLAFGIPSLALARDAAGFGGAFPGTLVATYAAHAIHDLQSVQTIPAPAQRADSSLPEDTVTPTATLKVTYHNFPAAARAAFQTAVDTWATQVVSSKVIHVNASWTALGTSSGILGEAGPTAFYLLNDNFIYPAALAEARCGCNKESGAEIQVKLNSQFPYWYKGTDGHVPSYLWDMETVVLHELGHGLGFLSSFDVVGSKGYWGFGSGGHNHPLRFDDIEWSAATGGSKMTSFATGSAALRKQLVDGSVYIGGSNVAAALGGRAKLYAPNPWNEGSSNSHFDETKYGTGTANALMTPVLNNGEANHAPGPAMLAVFRDIGWATS